MFHEFIIYTSYGLVNESYQTVEHG